MTSGAPWWVTLVVAAITAAAALGGSALVTWRQNARGYREEWFRRVQWAHELTESDRDQTQAAGYRLLELLGDSPLAKDEHAMTTQIPERQPAAGTGAGSRRVVEVSPATIAAARAQVTLSKALGRPVPAAISKIAGVR